MVHLRAVLPPVPVRASLALAFVAAAVFTATCATTPPDPSTPETVLDAPLGQEFTLRAAESVRIAGTALVLTFDRVTEDSRCPTDVNCIWAGNAVVRLATRVAGVTHGPIELHTTTADKRETPVDGYRVQLVRLMPTRTQGTTLTQDQYIATLTVVRSR